MPRPGPASTAPPTALTMRNTELTHSTEETVLEEFLPRKGGFNLF